MSTPLTIALRSVALMRPDFGIKSMARCPLIEGFFALKALYTPLTFLLQGFK